jgi:hypothetical protein
VSGACVSADGAWRKARTSNVLWLREAQSVDVPKYEPHEEICGANDEDGADTHVQGERGEVNTLKQATKPLRTQTATLA